VNREVEDFKIHRLIVAETLEKGWHALEKEREHGKQLDLR
jgi:hypothetical protein